MVKSQKSGYGGFAMGMIYRKLKDTYLNARGVFEEEPEGGEACLVMVILVLT
jgi:hypothetical protein